MDERKNGNLPAESPMQTQMRQKNTYQDLYHLSQDGCLTLCRPLIPEIDVLVSAAHPLSIYKIKALRVLMGADCILV